MTYSENSLKRDLLEMFSDRKHCISMVPEFSCVCVCVFECVGVAPPPPQVKKMQQKYFTYLIWFSYQSVHNVFLKNERFACMGHKVQLPVLFVLAECVGFENFHVIPVTVYCHLKSEACFKHN
jgi:hypothetical protein